jgi:uncharacterized protein YjdB
MDYKIVWKATTKEIQVLDDAAATPGGFTAIGTFSHPDTNDAVGKGYGHPLVQHVQDALYSVDVLSLQGVGITWPGKVNPTDFTVSPNPFTAVAGSSQTITPVFTPAEVSDNRYRFYASDKRVADVDHLGNAEFYQEGETHFHVETLDGKFLVDLKVNVLPAGSILLEGISVLPATANLAPAATQQLTVTYDPVDATNQAVTYSTSDATKATVSASGLITAVAAGTATITVTSVEGGFTDTCVVTVA